jgi:hypothetical protein
MTATNAVRERTKDDAPQRILTTKPQKPVAARVFRTGPNETTIHTRFERLPKLLGIQPFITE